MRRHQMPCYWGTAALLSALIQQLCAVLLEIIERVSWMRLRSQLWVMQCGLGVIMASNGVLMLTVLEARLYFIWFIVAALNWAAAMRIFNSQWLELEERHLVLISGQTIARGDILGLRYSLWKAASLGCALARLCRRMLISLAASVRSCRHGSLLAKFYRLGSELTQRCVSWFNYSLAIPFAADLEALSQNGFWVLSEQH